MKKSLIVMLIFILVVGAFFIGMGADFKNSVETTIENVSETKAITETTGSSVVHYEEPDTSPYEYQPEGFAKIGKNFDVLLEINDYYISEFNGESWVETETTYGTQGYYFEYPFIAPVRIYATKAEEPRVEYDWLDIWTDQQRLRSYDFIDDLTLFIERNEFFDDETFLLDDIIYTGDLCSIIKVTKDKFGFENDETDLYYIAFSYENIDKFKTVGAGEKSYNGSVGQVSYTGFEQRLIYF